jgi:xylulokinase
MRGDLILGLDVGTQGVKGILVDANGKVVAQQYVEHDCLYPRPDWCEHDMLQNWWRNPVAVIRHLLQTDGVLPDQIKVIGITGLYPAVGPTDGAGNPLSGAILYNDNRSVLEVEEVNRKQGLHLTSEEMTPKLIWLLRHRPEIAARMEMFFDAAHYLIYKLSGAYVQDTVTTGLHGAIYESPTASWRVDVCEKFGIPVKILPEVFPPATIVGKVNEKASEETGLLKGTPVISGMPDLMASMIAAGTVCTFETAAYYGTAGLMPVMKDDLIHAVFHPYPYPETGKAHQDGYVYDYPAYCLSVGDAVRWFRDEFGQMELDAERREGRPSAYARLDALAETTPAGSDGVLFLPYLHGQRSPAFNPWATGVFFGLKKAHTRGILFRSVLESFGYTMRHGLESFYPQGHPVKRLVATGGGARSPLWRQIVSDITGMAQEYVPEAEGTLGAAYVAGLALGWFSDFDHLKKQWVRVSATTEPNPKVRETYADGYSLYVDLHGALAPIFARHRSE